MQQEIIVEYLKRNFLSLSKQSTQEEIDAFHWIQSYGLMSLTQNGSLSINNDGKDFIRNAYYFNPVPVNVIDWRDNIINQLKHGQKILDGSGKLRDQAISELKQDGIIEQVGNSYFTMLTSTGRQLVSSGLSYNEFMNQRYLPQINNGNIFTGNVNHSDLRLNVENNRSHAAPANTQTKHPIKEFGIFTIKNIAKFIFYVLVAIAAWYFTVKHPIFQ